MEKNEFDIIIEKSYIFLKDRLKMDDIQAIVIISSLILLPISYFFGIGYTQISQFELAFYITLGIDLLTIIYSLVKFKYFQNRRIYFIKEFEIKIEQNQKIEIKTLSDLNKLNGYEFELFAKEFYTLQGFEAVETKYSHDYGADVIAYKDKDKYIIQAKRYSTPINYNAIYQADFAKGHYKADFAILFTNSDTNSRANEAAKRFNVNIVNGHDIDLFLRKKQSVVIKKK
jgi:HJR/Mrr/RecB family endonuclease